MTAATAAGIHSKASGFTTAAQQVVTDFYKVILEESSTKDMTTEETYVWYASHLISLGYGLGTVKHELTRYVSSAWIHVNPSPPLNE